jgi:hypothetical protein
MHILLNTSKNLKDSIIFILEKKEPNLREVVVFVWNQKLARGEPFLAKWHKELHWFGLNKTDEHVHCFLQQSF